MTAKEKSEIPQFAVGERVKTKGIAKVAEAIQVPAGAVGTVKEVLYADHAKGIAFPLKRRGYPAVWVEFDGLPLRLLMYASQLEADV